MQNRALNDQYVPIQHFANFGMTTVHTSKFNHDVKTLTMSATQSTANFITKHSIMDKERVVKLKTATQRTPSLLQLSMLNQHKTCRS